MTKKQAIQLFNDRRIRTAWDDKEEKWYFSVVDVIGVLTDSENPTTYWRVLKTRLKKEGNETVTNCNGLKMLAPDGKMRLTDVADQKQMFRLIQSIPSPKAEPFKQWKEWSGFTTREYKNFKGLHKENLRDHMTNLETAVNTLAEAFTTELSKKRNPKGLDQNKKVAKDGGQVAKETRQRMEKELGRSIVSPNNAKALESPDKPKEIDEQ